MINKIKESTKYIPMLIPSVIAFAVNCFCYLIPAFFIEEEEHIMIYTKIDEMIPFVPIFIVFYVGAFVQWFIYYIRVSFTDDDVKYSVLTAEVIIKVICMILFVVLPYTFPRPEVQITGPITWLVNFIYVTDKPYCIFPSIHCVQSHLAYRLSVITERHDTRWQTVIAFIFSMCVYASTVLVKQHLFMDAVFGILISEIVLQICLRTHIGKKVAPLFSKINNKIERSNN